MSNIEQTAVERQSSQHSRSDDDAYWIGQYPAVLAEVQEAMSEDSRLSGAAIARGIGRSHATVSNWLNNNLLPQSKAGNTRIVYDFLRSYKARRAVASDPPFTRTSISDRIHDTIVLAHYRSCMTAVLAPFGVGKTAAAEDYAEKNSAAFLITAGPGWTGAAMSRAIAEALGIPHNHRTGASVLRQTIVDALTGRNAVLILDEIELADPSCLHEVRIICDQADAGLVLLFSAEFREKLKMTAFAGAITSRIRLVERIKETPETDIRLILNGLGIGQAVVNQIVRESERNARKAVQILMVARTFAGDDGLTVDGVREAADHVRQCTI